MGDTSGLFYDREEHWQFPLPILFQAKIISPMFYFAVHWDSIQVPIQVIDQIQSCSLTKVITLLAIMTVAHIHAYISRSLETYYKIYM